jgi:hypothetical protein
MIWQIWMKCEMIRKIWKKSKLKSEKIWKIWKKSKLNSEMIWKIWKISVLVIITPQDNVSECSDMLFRWPRTVKCDWSCWYCTRRTSSRAIAHTFPTWRQTTINHSPHELFFYLTKYDRPRASIWSLPRLEFNLSKFR